MNAERSKEYWYGLYVKANDRLNAAQRTLEVEREHFGNVEEQLQALCGGFDGLCTFVSAMAEIERIAARGKQ